jgi:hypothetical protein
MLVRGLTASRQINYLIRSQMMAADTAEKATSLDGFHAGAGLLPDDVRDA